MLVLQIALVGESNLYICAADKQASCETQPPPTGKQQSGEHLSDLLHCSSFMCAPFS